MRRRLRWLAVLAAVLAVGIAVAPGPRARIADLVLRFRTRRAVEQLVAALRSDQLPVARFSVLGTSGTQSTMRGPAGGLEGQSRAGQVLDVASQSSSPDAIAATAAALAVTGKGPSAISALEAAVARAPADARLWSDLAAANLEANRVLRALVAADAALRIDPQSADALYNRALALDRIGLTMVAADTWRRCLEASPDAQLATEVRKHLTAAEVPSEAARWPAAQKALLRAATAGETAEVTALTAQFPRLVRAYAEGPYMNNWASAYEQGDPKADEWLRIVRTAGEALRRRGETLLSDVAGTIDESLAANDTARVHLLARAHLTYVNGRMAYRDREYTRAEHDLREAAAMFATARSPMEQVAQSWTAAVVMDVARTDEAQRMLVPLVSDERVQRGHRALVAASEHALAGCEMYAGRWNEAVDASKAAAALFHQIGETSNAAESEDMLAVLLDLLGQPDVAWEHRLRAFRTANDAGVLNRLLVAVSTGTRAAMYARDHELALSLLDVEMWLAAQVRDPTISADMLTRRVLLQHERGAFDDRDTALARARVAIGAVPDRAERTRLTIELDGAEAIAVRDASPQRAVELLGRAVRFCQENDRRPYLPSFLLQLGRAHLAAGDGDAAWRAFAQAMDELEAQRGAIRDLELRSRMLDTAEELFDEALAFQVGRGDAAAAFAVAERARARGLLDATGGAAPVVSAQTVASRLEAGTVAVEYAVLPDMVVIFSIGPGGLRMHTVPVKADRLTADRSDLANLLLAPVREDLGGAASVVFIPDKILQRVPFASLPWNGRYLIETHTVSVAPSASVLRPERVIGPKQRSVLIVGNPAPNPELKLELLPSVEREVASVSAIYRPARVLFGVKATKARFAADAPGYDVIHFGGHGVSDEESLTASLLFARDGSDPGRMYTADIEKLRLTRNPLVVLAACGTLRGRARGKEGMPSLARSFLAAGASTVVGTLWNVDDNQSGPLMTAFHRRIAAGETPASALRTAQLEAIARSGADAESKNWAAFVVYTVRP
jgi:tetratricopeptide (TPR) repeat protein